MKFIDTDAKIVAMIASIGKRGASIQSDIHRAGCSIFNRWCMSQDVSTAVKHLNMLLEQLPTMVRKNSFKEWGVCMGGLVWSAENQFAYNKKKTVITVKEVQEAKAKAFWEFKPEPEYKATVLNDLLISALKRAEKVKKNGIDVKKGDVIDDDQLNSLKALIQA